MDLKASIHSSQVESLSELKVPGNIDYLEAIFDHSKSSVICDKAIQVGVTPDFNDNCSATLFSGIGEEISLMSGTAVSRANSLKYEGDYYSLEAVFTSDEYSDMSPKYILQSVVPIIEKFDVHYIWNIFKNVIENRMTSLPEENSLSEMEWLKEPTFRLAKILYYLSKKMQFMQSEPLQSVLTVDKWSNVLVSELLEGFPSTVSEEAQGDVKEKKINRQDLNKLLCKTDELQHQILCLRGENAQIQDMLADAGRNLEIANEENFHLKNQLYRAKVNLNEIDNLTSEIWSLKAKLGNYERSDRRKRRRLEEIEEQKTILFMRVHDVEEKIQRWHSIVEDAKNEINSLKYLIRIQEKRVMSAIEERTLTEFHVNELTQINSDLESSVKELIGANDALRSDKHILKKQLEEMQCLMMRKEEGCQNNNTFECMYSILQSIDNNYAYHPKKKFFQCEDSKASEEKINSSSVHTVVAKERVNADLQKSIEVKSGSSSLQKSLGSDENAKGFLDEEIGLQKKNSASGKSLICHTSDVRDQINEEIRALREQLVRSQVLFTYLLKDGSTDHTPKGLDCKTHLRTLLEEGNLSDVIFQCKSFDGQVPARFYNRSNRSSSSYASHRSTPMHCGYTSQSCPTLPIESPVVTKATQTEPMTGETFYMRTGTNGVLSATSSNSLNKGNVFFSPPSTPCENICDPLVITDVCEVHREPENHSFPRHRTNSFLSAVKDGNPKLIDATESNARSSEFDDSISYSEKKRSKKSNFIDNCFEAEYFEQSSKAIDSELRGVIEDNKECTFPRKLSILLEEDYEDASGNYFSVCSSQPFLNRKKKLSPSCNVKTQTDLSISSQSPSIQNQTPLNKTVSDDLPVKEFCLPRHGYSIITAAIQKKTVYSEELPHKLVLRHPPPYTKHRSKSSGCMSSGTSYFQECHSKPKTYIYKWATVAESLPSKSDFSHNLTPKTRNDSSLQTRHLSLEKQESFSSCDHSLYPDSQMSSITDCSGWMTKSDIELNARPDPPSYQQTIIASQRNQSTRNRSENLASGKKPSVDQHGISTTMRSGLVKSESDTRAADEKNENSKEKNFKTSQRSMRRGSGAGSPNSQLSIPRYPAFDFGEQEDAQSLFPSPSETEANRNIKAEILQGMKNSELGSEGDSNQSNSKSLKETSQKKRDTNKSKTLMPELMENSETESAKGSFECEAPDLPPSVDAPPVPMIDIAFPSLPNTFLAKLGVHKDSPLSVEAFDEQELESKFIALSLAFKTDRTTLSKRLELHKRHRDMAEKNVENEFQAMREHLNALNLKATKADVRELISKIQNHLDIAQQATSRVSGRSETYGAVQQEERVSRAFEVLVLHVDHLKRLFDKEHKELEETRRMLTDTQAFRKDVVGESATEDQKKYLRAFGLPVGAIKSVGRRRASVAEFQQSSVQENRRPPSFNQSWTSGYGPRKVEPRQRTLCPFPTASSVGLSSSSLPTSQVTSISPSRISTVSISARRCSLPASSPLVPNMLQNLEATPKNLNLTVQPLPSSDKQKKKERNFWTRKLSSVRDEQDEDECEDEKGLFPNQSPSEVTKHLAMSNKSLDSEAYFQQFDADDESEEMSDSEENNVSESSILQILRISSMKDLFNQGIQKLSEMMLQYYSGEIDFRNIWTFYSFIIIIILLCIWIFLYFSMETISSLVTV